MHIGKSSAGWCFALHVEPDRPGYPQSLDDWKVVWSTPGWSIRDEYDVPLTAAEMLAEIQDRSWPERERSDEFLRQNSAVIGPSGLLRNAFRAGRCVGHGEGTWDLIAGEFS